MALNINRPSIRALLLTAIGLLLLVVMIMGTIAILTLNNAERRLATFHDQTLNEVTDALELSRNASKLASSAPFLMTLSPSFQLESTAKEILATINHIDELGAGDPALVKPLNRTRVAIDDLVGVMAPQSAKASSLSLIDQDLERLQRRFRGLVQSTEDDPDLRQGWSALQQMVMVATGALRTEELIKVGEYQRQYRRLLQEVETTSVAELSGALDDVKQAVQKRGNLFSLRYSELAATLDAENALFRIRMGVEDVNTFAVQKVNDARQRLQASRDQTATSLTFAKAVIVVLTVISLAVAVGSTLFVSRYVVGSLHRITAVMQRLAAGDLRARLPKNAASSDEIGQLSEAFRKFRSNALRLDRKTKEIWRRNELFNNVFQNITDGVAVISPNGQIIAENGRVRELLRLEPGKADDRWTVGQLLDLSPFEPHANEGDRAGFAEYVDAGGRVLEVRQSSLPDGGSVWLFSETTERKQVDQRLEEIRRVESLGKVTGEVAHDFGNILSTISGNLHMLEGELSPKAKAMGARINDAVELGVSLIERLLAFARKQHLAPQETDIASIVYGMEDLLSMALPETVNLTITCEDGPMYARIDPGQLESAILNLCVNAGQAISGNGNIELSVSRQDGGGVSLSVADDGCGMDADTLRQAAEPFFTARADGEGTGLGLSMVHGFVHQSGGDIHIASQPGNGTRVVLTFPPYTRAEEIHHKPFAAQRQALVVDDDPVSAKSISSALTNLGFDVSIVHSFAEAQSLITQSPDLALLVTDLQLDNSTSGWPLAQLALEACPHCRVIVVSGHLPADDPVDGHFRSRFAKFPKPVSEKTLADYLTSQLAE